jgi:hypothetical protein
MLVCGVIGASAERSRSFLRFPDSARLHAERMKYSRALYDSVFERAKTFRSRVNGAPIMDTDAVRVGRTAAAHETIPQHVIASIDSLIHMNGRNPAPSPTAGPMDDDSNVDDDNNDDNEDILYLQVRLHEDYDCDEDVVAYASFGTSMCLPISTSTSISASFMLTYDESTQILSQNLYLDDACSTLLYSHEVADLADVTLGTCQDGVEVVLSSSFDPPDSRGELTW